jgi:hypothetical protein
LWPGDHIYLVRIYPLRLPDALNWAAGQASTERCGCPDGNAVVMTSRIFMLNTCRAAQRRRAGVTSSRSSCPSPPFVTKLGIVADVLDDAEVRLRLPWDPSNVTIGDMVHGGALATFADLTVMAAVWCGAEVPDSLRGVTVSLALPDREGDRHIQGGLRGDLPRLGRGGLF